LQNLYIRFSIGILQCMGKAIQCTETEIVSSNLFRELTIYLIYFTGHKTVSFLACWRSSSGSSVRRWNSADHPYVDRPYVIPSLSIVLLISLAQIGQILGWNCSDVIWNFEYQKWGLNWVRPEGILLFGFLVDKN